MKHRFIKGVTAGMIAGVVKNIPEAALHHYPRVTETTLWDYAGTIALGRLPRGWPEIGYAFFLEILFTTFLGLIFVNIPLLNRYEHQKLRGILFGALVWFIIRVAVVAFDIRVLLVESLETSIVNLLASMFYGCVLVCAIKYLDRKVYQ
jgi:hypothetical protein